MKRLLAALLMVLVTVAVSQAAVFPVSNLGLEACQQILAAHVEGLDLTVTGGEYHYGGENLTYAVTLTAKDKEGHLYNATILIENGAVAGVTLEGGVNGYAI